MPMAPEIGFELGHDDEVERAGRDRQITSGADVGLAGRMGLDGCHDVRRAHRRHPENRAHATTATVASTARTTIATSTTDLVPGRNGLNPISFHGKRTGRAVRRPTGTLRP